MFKKLPYLLKMSVSCIADSFYLPKPTMSKF